MKRIIAAIALSLGLLVGAATAASAAPIECPDGQTAQKVDDGHGGKWDCVNNGGNSSNAEDPKNPNVGKGFF